MSRAERYRGAPAPGHDGRALALHRPARLRPGLLRRRRRAGRRAGRQSMLELDAAASVTVTESGLADRARADGRRDRAARASTSSSATLVGPDEKFAAHNAALWENGLLVRVPRGVVLEKPVYVRITNGAEGGSALLAPPRRGRARVAAHARRGVRVGVARARPATRTPSPSSSSARRAKLEYVSIQNLSRGDLALRLPPRARRARRRARLGRRRLRLEEGQDRGSRTTSPAPARPRASPVRTSPTATQHLDYDTFQEHMAPSTTSDFAFKGALRDRATSVWRGMIRVEPDAQKTNAYQENRNLLLSEQAHADSIPGLEIMANDVRCTHGATISQVDRDELFYLHGPRALARRRRAADRPRLLPEIFDRIEFDPVREALERARGPHPRRLTPVPHTVLLCSRQASRAVSVRPSPSLPVRELL